MIAGGKFCTREATLKDNATTQKVNRTYQQVVTLNYTEYPAMEWQLASAMVVC
ncbi:MAG: hypothetical protein ACLR17_11815 [Enterobacteriaceae bacterium]